MKITNNFNCFMITLAVFFFSSCFKPIPVETPILSEEKVKAILKDIHLAESLLTETIDRNAKDSLARVYYDNIFHLHQVSHEDFDQSMNAYFSNPAALDSLYDHIILEIAAEKNAILEKNNGDKPTPLGH